MGREAKALPCVINPHGGPWARDVWGYNPEVQFLANRGYCVLQMNFRGFAGYGHVCNALEGVVIEFEFETVEFKHALVLLG